ncbi:unnamed protein product [Euphydryas editha]|uniref:RNA-directed DNA polymerase n=1 Tax=Euphydryas editha TaxID=104508 RepID=A0AAU9TVG6_EUPED|nr:unnamed protein product [Euphydryas editha]
MDKLMVKLPPSFDLRASNAASEWRLWRASFEDYLISTKQDVSSDRIKLALLRNMIGIDSARVLLTLPLTEDKASNYESVMAAIEKYVSPRVNEVFEIYKFNERKQKQGEAFDNFFTDCKQLLLNCNYRNCKGESIEDQLLRDKIVQGIADKSIQESLLRIDGLTLEKASNFCRTSEQSKLQVKEMNPTLDIDYSRSQSSKTNQGCMNNRGSNNSKTNQGCMTNRSSNNNKTRWSNKSSRYANNKEEFKCRRCQTIHGPRKCPAYGQRCNKCGIKNHFAVSCKVNRVEKCDEELYCHTAKVVSSVNKSDWYENIIIETLPVKCKLDTGADVSIMPLEIFQKINSKLNVKLLKTNIKLESFNGNVVEPLGMVNLMCKFKNTKSFENFVIVKCKTTLLGLPGCISLNLIKRVNSIESSVDIEKDKFILKHQSVFQGVGKLPGKYTIVTKPFDQQICHPPSRIPNCLLDPLKCELDRLENRNSIVKVDKISENSCINRIVIVEKSNKNVRLCLDPSDLNKYIIKKPKILPTLDQLAIKLKGKKFFSVLDLSEGFHHLTLDEESSWKCCFATPFGVYRYLVLPYGLMNAPELFQDVLESYFSKFNNVVVWADDILVMGNSAEDHDRALIEVINKAKEIGIVFNKNKFQYKQKEVKYVGQIFNEHGMSVDKSRVESLIKLKSPTNRDQLMSIIGSFNYVRRYVPEMAELMSPLCKLLKKNVEFMWLPVHERAFEKLKEKVSCAPALCPFDPNKKIILQCDASSNGLGCCMFQRDDLGNLKLIACVSRTMNDFELNYGQTEKELLAIHFGTKKFHNYIYGSHIDIQTDHKPIVSIMCKQISKIGSPRLKRLRLKLLIYNLNVYYVPGKLVHFADMLSRNCLNYTEHDHEMLQVVHTVSKHIPMSDERKAIFRNETYNDPVLSKLCSYFYHGWPSKLNKDIYKHYAKLKEQLYVQDGFLFYCNRIVVPQKLKSYVIGLVHDGHIGINKRVSKARQLFYWPGLSDDIQNFVSKCRTCEKFRSANVHEPMLPHKIPKYRYYKVGMDIMEYAGKSYLIIIDYLSHWLEIRPLNNKNSKSVIDSMQEVFTRFGYPVEIIADNNPFKSFDCLEYYKCKDINLITSSPYYPRSNGLAEKAVNISKNIIKKALEDGRDYRDYLMCYNNSPLSGLSVSPSQILNSRNVRSNVPSCMSYLEPRIVTNIHKLLSLKQSVTKAYHDKSAKKNEVRYKPGDKIVYCTEKDKVWRKGVVVKKCKEPRSYLISRGSNTRPFRRNSYHLRKSYSNVDKFYRDKYVPFENEILEGNIDIKNDNSNRLGTDNQYYVTRSGRTVKPKKIFFL